MGYRSIDAKGVIGDDIKFLNISWNRNFFQNIFVFYFIKYLWEFMWIEKGDVSLLISTTIITRTTFLHWIFYLFIVIIFART